MRGLPKMDNNTLTTIGSALASLAVIGGFFWKMLAVLQKKFDKIDTRFDKIDSELKDINGRVHRIEGYLFGLDRPKTGTDK